MHQSLPAMAADASACASTSGTSTEQLELDDIFTDIAEQLEKESLEEETPVCSKATKKFSQQPKALLTASIIREVLTSVKSDLALAHLVKAEYLEDELLPHFVFINECLVRRGFFLCASKEEVYANFHKAVSKKIKSIGKILESEQLAGWVCLRIIERLVTLNYSEVPPPTPPVKCSDLRDDEVDIVQYISGFVLQHIKKAVFRLTSSDTKWAKLDCVNKLLDINGENAQKLIRCKTRGGLLCPKQNLLDLFIELEQLFRRKFQGNSTTHLSRNAFVDDAVNNDHVVCSFYECAYTSWASDTVKEQMLHDIFTIYFHTRCHSKCRQIMERYRFNAHKSKKEKALRKSLKQKSKMQTTDGKS